MKSENARRLIFRATMAVLIVFFATTYFTRGHTSLSEDFVDGMRGTLLGIAIGLMVLFLVATRRARNHQD